MSTPIPSERTTLFSSLIGQARAGDDDAWGKILASYEKALKRKARHALPADLQRKESPSDVVQQTLGIAFRNRDRFLGKTPAELRAWLLRIQWNRIRMVLRQYLGSARHNVLREVPIDAVGASGIREPGAPATEDPERERLAAAVEKLSDAERQLLSWRYTDELTFAGIGERLGIKEDAARMQVTRLVADLRRRMGEDNGD